MLAVADPKGNAHSSRKREATGRFSVSCQLDCLLVTEIIGITCGYVRSVTQQATVEVKKYVLPKFKIDVELDKPITSRASAALGR